VASRSDGADVVSRWRRARIWECECKRGTRGTWECGWGGAGVGRGVRKSEGSIAKGGEDQPNFVKVGTEIANFPYGMFDGLIWKIRKLGTLERGKNARQREGRGALSQGD